MLSKLILVQIFKIISLGAINAVGVWAAVSLYTQHNYSIMALLIVGLLLINLVFIPRRGYPLRYIIPGTLFMLAMVVYPLLYTINVSFTNYGTGHVLTREQAIEQLENRYFQPEDARSYSFQAFKDEENNFILLLKDNQDNLYLGMEGEAQPIDPDDPRLEDSTGDGQVDTIMGHQKLEQSAIFPNLSRLQNVRFQEGDYQIRMISFQEFTRFMPRFEYLPEKDAMKDLRDDILYYTRVGAFISPEGERLSPGFRTHVGFLNFQRLIQDPRIFRPFLRVFVWTFQWAFLSMATTFILGLFLSLLLNDKHIRFRVAYRIFLIIPYAIPPFISALVWRGLFNTELGIINQILNSPIPWLQDPFLAKVALVVLNLWLGFPYMMLICLGALQSISSEMYEAAVVDGASLWQQFRSITFPLLLVSITPLLISSFAFNFNNFNIIYLLTEGRPPIAGAGTPAGHTDILISYTYRLAFESGRGADYGLAAAVTILIFLIVATISWFNYRFTGALEEVKENV